MMGTLVNGLIVGFRCHMGTMQDGSIKVGSIDIAPTVTSGVNYEII